MPGCKLRASPPAQRASGKGIQPLHSQPFPASGSRTRSGGTLREGSAGSPHRIPGLAVPAGRPDPPRTSPSPGTASGTGSGNGAGAPPAGGLRAREPGCPSPSPGVPAPLRRGMRAGDALPPEASTSPGHPKAELSKPKLGGGWRGLSLLVPLHPAAPPPSLCPPAVLLPSCCSLSTPLLLFRPAAPFPPRCRPSIPLPCSAAGAEPCPVLAPPLASPPLRSRSRGAPAPPAPSPPPLPASAPALDPARGPSSPRGTLAASEDATGKKKKSYSEGSSRHGAKLGPRPPCPARGSRGGGEGPERTYLQLSPSSS